MLENLAGSIGLKICEKPFLQITSEATQLDWTRDPFDCLIVAASISSNAELITKDQTILDNYDKAIWE
jgi:PIN domain nuclease of toxin-antitoxin system